MVQVKEMAKVRVVVVERVEEDAKENEKLNGVKKPEDAENAELTEEESPDEINLIIFLFIRQGFNKRKIE